MKLKIFGFISYLLIVSCSVEKVNLSPTSDLLVDIDKKTPINFSNSAEKKLKFIRYSSEITNAFSSVSHFSKKEVNDEISTLRHHISEYIYAVKEHNQDGEEKAHSHFKKSYTKLQEFKSLLNEDEKEVLNRFLVNIKTNVSHIASLKDSI
ncbi:MAG: hypothetical protein Q4A00_00340 [Flavobacteriaceae bacterium]|nr:hypothetical protein [Flavobacteriaceae bacterium]